MHTGKKDRAASRPATHIIETVAKVWSRKKLRLGSGDITNVHSGSLLTQPIGEYVFERLPSLCSAAQSPTGGAGIKRRADEVHLPGSNWNPPFKAVKVVTAADHDDPTDGITAALADLSLEDIDDATAQALRDKAESDEAEARELRRLACAQFELDCDSVVETAEAQAADVSSSSCCTEQQEIGPEDVIDSLQALLEIFDDGCRVSWPMGWDVLSVRQLLRQSSRTRT